MTNILITGIPGIGKTTLIEQILFELNKVGLSILGFITKEVREGNKRIGFTIELIENNQLSGIKYTLATKTGTRTPYRIGSYNVEIQNLETVVDYLAKQQSKKKLDLIIIDEIGKMELLSNKFRKYIIEVLDSRKLLATISLKDNLFTKQVKARKDTILLILQDRREFNSIKEKILQIILKYQDQSPARETVKRSKDTLS